MGDVKIGEWAYNNLSCLFFLITAVAAAAAAALGLVLVSC